MSKRAAVSLRITEPNYNDVLLGRGGKNNRHTGNDVLREIAKKHCVKYRSSQKKDKTAITRRIVSEMKTLSPPARFLRKIGEHHWEEVSDDVAREKVSQVLRDAVNAIEQRENDQKNQSLQITITDSTSVEEEYSPIQIRTTRSSMRLPEQHYESKISSPHDSDMRYAAIDPRYNYRSNEAYNSPPPTSSYYSQPYAYQHQPLFRHPTVAPFNTQAPPYATAFVHPPPVSSMSYAGSKRSRSYENEYYDPSHSRTIGNRSYNVLPSTNLPTTPIATTSYYPTTIGTQGKSTEVSPLEQTTSSTDIHEQRTTVQVSSTIPGIDIDLLRGELVQSPPPHSPIYKREQSE